VNLLRHSRCCVQSLGHVTGSPVYSDATRQVLLTYDKGDKCDNGRRWRTVISFICAERQLQVCFSTNNLLYILVAYGTHRVCYLLSYCTSKNCVVYLHWYLYMCVINLALWLQETIIFTYLLALLKRHSISWHSNHIYAFIRPTDEVRGIMFSSCPSFCMCMCMCSGEDIVWLPCRNLVCVSGVASIWS